MLARVNRKTSALVACAAILGASCTTSPVDVTERSPVSYSLRLEIRDGESDAFHSLMQAMVDSAKNEVGTLVYEWYLDADGKTCHIHEHFADTAAYRVHSDNFATKFADRFLPMVEIQGMTVFGNADAAARKMLATLSPQYLKAIGGFRR